MNWRSTSDDTVTVCPNMTCPISMVISFVVFTNSASRDAADENLRLPSTP